MEVGGGGMGGGLLLCLDSRIGCRVGMIGIGFGPGLIEIVSDGVINNGGVVGEFVVAFG